MILFRYRERIYCFSSEDAKEEFRQNPLEYTSLNNFKVDKYRESARNALTTTTPMLQIFSSDEISVFKP